MDCSSAHGILPLYFDGELDRTASREFEAHLERCADCSAALIELDSLRRGLRTEAPRYTAPQALRERIQTHATKPVVTRPFGTRTRWLALAASWAFAFIAGTSIVPLWRAHDNTIDEQTTRDLFASHWRALAAASPVDVISTDRHTVRPWFAGKVAQAPLVQDFAEQGFTLIGGRIDYVGSQRVPVLAYRHGQHLIDVFVLPRAAASQIGKTAQRQGYSLDTITLGGQSAAIVSDMDSSELEHFARLLSDMK